MVIEIRPHHLETMIENEQKGTIYDVFFSILVFTIYGKTAYEGYKQIITRVREGEEMQLTKNVDCWCENCPYQRPCIEGNVKEATKLLPWFYRLIGAKLPNTQNQDEIALRNLRINEGKRYRLSDFV
jgi:hypothetical protein